MTDFLSRHILTILLTLALLTGVLVYRDFGIAWDEDVSYVTGLVNYNYVFENDTSLHSFVARDYGAAFELPAAVAIKALGAEDMRDSYMIRRILCYLLFVIACAFIFKLTYLLYRDKVAASGAFLMLWLHPHMFSHAFFNSKDIPFLSFLVITLYLLFTAIQTQKWWWFCLAGAAAGLLTGTRIPGVIYVGLGAAWIVSEAIFRRRAGSGLLWSGLFCICSALALYISWPNLWSAPVENFMAAFDNMAKFRWDLTVLFGNRYIPTNELPWYYIPVWFVISMPILFLVAGVCGILRPFWLAIAGRRFDFPVRTGFFLLLCFVLPVVAIIVMHSVVYDGWRHLYFVYAPFVLLSAGALHELSKKTGRGAIAAIVVMMLPVSFFHFHAHPLQYVHFNVLTKHHEYDDLRYEYELDYWGIGYKQGLEYLLENDTAAEIPVSAQNLPVELSLKFLPEADRKRIRLAPLEDARYFLTNYRWHRHDYYDLSVKTELIKTFKVCGNTVHGVYRIVH